MWSRGWFLLVLACAACRLGFQDVSDGGPVGDKDGRGPDTPGSTSNKVLFIRGGAGTVGLNNAGGDFNACDATEHVNGEGWGSLANLLGSNGFTVVQHLEGPLAARAPADISNLAQYGIVVFGSNNFVYSSADADAVEAFVRAGGAVLFISDAGFGKTTFAEAPTSDQTFAGRFDLVIDQDNGSGVPMTVMRAQFVQPNHPVLVGVLSFQATGTSPITVVDNVADVTPQVLVPVTGNVRNNDAPMGTSRAATAADGALVVAEVGAGRVAAYFDRDTWTNGSLAKNSDTALATNLFRWLQHDL